MKTGFRLGHWTVWPQLDRIDGHGETIHITPKSMAVLECLARAQGEVVSRNEVLDAVWPGADVTDDVLTHSVTELRKAFGDSPQDPRVIETIPKKGLRLMLEVAWFDESDGESGDHGARRSRVSAALRIWSLLVIVIAGLFAWFYFVVHDGGVPNGVTDVDKSIAVLPFVDMSPDKDQQYLADGLAEELTYRLSRLDGLLVVGRSAYFPIGGTSQDPRSAISQLSVDFFLDGSIRRVASDVRITAQLIDADEGFHLWSHSFNRPFADIIEIQDEIATAVANALSVELGVGEPDARIGSTSNLSAYEQVMLGDSYMDWTAAGMDRAISHYRRAVELDPDYAIAWQRIANFYSWIRYVTGQSDRAEQYELAYRAISRAMELAPESPIVLATAADVQLRRHNWLGARRLYDRVAALTSPYSSLGPGIAGLSSPPIELIYRLGYASEEVRQYDTATQTDPDSLVPPMYVVRAYLSVGRIDDALADLQRGYTLEGDMSPLCDVGVVVALSIDDPDLIRLWLERAWKHQRPGAKGANQAMVERLFDRERALAWLHRTYEAGPELDYYVILWASYYGDDELALKAMRRSLDLWLFWIPLTAHLRKTEEFRDIVRDAGLVDYWREYGWNDFCRPLGQTDFECR